MREVQTVNTFPFLESTRWKVCYNIWFVFLTHIMLKHVNSDTFEMYLDIPYFKFVLYVTNID